MKLLDYLEKAAALGAESVEIECEDGREWITAFRGKTSIEIGSESAERSAALLAEIEMLIKQRVVALSGQRYRLSMSERESFGETVYLVRMKKVT